MRRHMLRLLALPIAAVGTSAAIVATSGAAYADGGIAGGTGTVTFLKSSFTTPLRLAGIGVDFAGETSLVHNSTDKTVTFPVSGGDGEVTTLSGNVNFGGSIEFENWYNGKDVVLSSLTYDLFNSQFDGTSSVDGTQQPLFDPSGDITTTESGTAETFNTTDITLDPAGAAYLNWALRTTVFTAGESIGSFSTAYSY